MLMAPGPSSWAAGAPDSRSPVGADSKIGPEVDARAVVASQEAHRAVRLLARESNALTSSHKTQESASGLSKHAAQASS